MAKKVDFPPPEKSTPPGATREDLTLVTLSELEEAHADKLREAGKDKRFITDSNKVKELQEYQKERQKELKQAQMRPHEYVSDAEYYRSTPGADDAPAFSTAEKVANPRSENKYDVS